MISRRACNRGSQTVVSLSLRLKDLLGPVTRERRKKKPSHRCTCPSQTCWSSSCYHICTTPLLKIPFRTATIINNVKFDASAQVHVSAANESGLFGPLPRYHVCNTPLFEPPFRTTTIMNNVQLNASPQVKVFIANESGLFGPPRYRICTTPLLNSPFRTITFIKNVKSDASPQVKVFIANEFGVFGPRLCPCNTAFVPHHF